MSINEQLWKWTALAMVASCAFARSAFAADSIELPSLQGRLMQMQLFDRSTGSLLPTYAKNGRYYSVGVPGHEYAIRLRNTSGGRILVVTSVDGVNVVSGETASASQSGYVLEPWGSVELAGWRKSLERTAAFYFTDLGDSYAARTGRPYNVGVIGVAAFEERPRVAVSVERPAAAPIESRSQNAGSAASQKPAPSDSAASSANRMRDALGTGHGRSETSVVTAVAFERATDTPADSLAIRYDSRDNLLAMRVLPKIEYAQRAEPNAFPADLRFTPDPR